MGNFGPKTVRGRLTQAAASKWPHPVETRRLFAYTGLMAESVQMIRGANSRYVTDFSTAQSVFALLSHSSCRWTRRRSELEEC